MNFVPNEWLQQKLCSNEQLIILDCRNSFDFEKNHIKNAINLSIPAIMLRRLQAGKIDLLATIRAPELKNRIERNYENGSFVLYNDKCLGGEGAGGVSASVISSTENFNVLHRILQEDNRNVFCLKDGFQRFHQQFPEWCEDAGKKNVDILATENIKQDDHLMGLSTLRISTSIEISKDSACSSSAESSDCENSFSSNNSYPQHRFTDEPIEIINGLYLGNETHSKDERALQKYKIKYVLNVTPDLPNSFEEDHDMHYLKIPIVDRISQNLSAHFPKCIEFIDEGISNGSAVLVHCLAGVSRSVTVTLAYLMHTKSLTLNEAFSLVKSRKPDVSPNFDFMEQLHTFEHELKDLHNKKNSERSMDHENSTEFIKRKTDTTDEDKRIGVSPDSGIEFDRWTSAEAHEGSSFK